MFPLSNPILLRCVRTGKLVNNALGGAKLAKTLDENSPPPFDLKVLILRLN